MKKKTILLLGALAFSAAIALNTTQTSCAANNNGALSNHDFNTPSSYAEKAQKEDSSVNFDKQNKTANIIKYGQNAINARIYSLNRFIKQTEALKTITADQKNAISAMVNEQIKGLNALSVKLKTETDSNAARADAKSIYSTYRIYAVFLPKVRFLRELYVRENYLSKYYSTLAPKTKEDLAINGGKCGYIPRQAGLNTAESLASSALIKINETRAKTMEISPVDYPQSYKNEIEAVNAGLKEIKNQLDQIRNLLKNSYSYNVKNCSCDLDKNGFCDEKDWNVFQTLFGKSGCIIKGRNYCTCDKNNDGKCDANDWTLFADDWGKAAQCNKNKACDIGENNKHCPSDCPALQNCIADFNQDGKVNPADEKLFRADLNRIDCANTAAACKCDLNKDGKCDLRDWTLLGKDFGKTCAPASTAAVEQPSLPGLPVCLPSGDGGTSTPNTTCCDSKNSLKKNHPSNTVGKNWFNCCQADQCATDGTCINNGQGFDDGSAICRNGIWETGCPSGKLLKPLVWGGETKICCTESQCGWDGCVDSGFKDLYAGKSCANGIWQTITDCSYYEKSAASSSPCCDSLTATSDNGLIDMPKICCNKNECVKNGKCYYDGHTFYDKLSPTMKCKKGYWEKIYSF